MATILSYALTTLADVKETLGLDAGNTSKDNLIIRMINRATEEIEGYCNSRRFAETTYNNEEYDGTSTNQLILKNRPVTSTTTFVLQQRQTTENDDDWETVDTELYFTDDNAGVVDSLFTFQRNWNRYRVTYSAGYSTIPSDLAEACATLAAFYVDNPITGTGVASKEEGGRKITYFAPAQGLKRSTIISLGLDDVLNRYTEPPLLDDK